MDLAVGIPEQSCNTWYYEYFEKCANNKYKNCNNSYSLLQAVHLILFVGRMSKNFLVLIASRNFFAKWEDQQSQRTDREDGKKIQTCQFPINHRLFNSKNKKYVIFYSRFIQGSEKRSGDILMLQIKRIKQKRHALKIPSIKMIKVFCRIDFILSYKLFGDLPQNIGA